MGSRVAPPGRRSEARSLNPEYRCLRSSSMVLPLWVNRGKESFAAITIATMMRMIRKPTLVRPLAKAINSFIKPTPPRITIAKPKIRVRIRLTKSSGSKRTLFSVTSYSWQTNCNVESSNIEVTSSDDANFLSNAFSIGLRTESSRACFAVLNRVPSHSSSPRSINETTATRIASECPPRKYAISKGSDRSIRGALLDSNCQRTMTAARSTKTESAM